MLLSLVPLLLLVAIARSELTLTATPGDVELVWKTDLTLSCTWDPEKSKAAADIVVNGESVFNENGEYSTKGTRVTVEEGEGFMKLNVPQVMGTDSGAEFVCMMSRVGSSQPYTIKVLEPPAAATASLSATAEFTKATITFDPVNLETNPDTKYDATKYKVEYKTESASEWIEHEMEGTTMDLTGLEVATTYTVRVRPGNRAGYRDGEELIKSTQFTTKDNRPPKPVDNLEATTAAYDATEVTLKWALDSNKGLIIKGISIQVMKDGAEVESITVNDISATEWKVSVDGPGSYEFILTTSNDFSEGVETGATVSQIVKETTKAPTEPPVPPTETPVVALLCKKPASADYKVDTADNAAEPEGETETGETEGEKTNEAESQITVVEVKQGEKVTMQCFLDTLSTFQPENITWSNADFKGVLKDDPKVNMSVAQKEGENLAVSTFTFLTVDENHQGSYKCELRNETCEFQLLVQGAAVAPDSGAVARALGPSLLLLLLACLL